MFMHRVQRKRTTCDGNGRALRGEHGLMGGRRQCADAWSQKVDDVCALFDGEVCGWASHGRERAESGWLLA